VATNVLGPVEELGALALGAAIVVAYFALPVSQSFALANVIGVAIALSTLPLLDLRTFVIGASFLLGLLCYDFFWVFRSDVMMTVATTIEAPVKFEFPTADPTRPFSILGLGDVVIPGSFVALMRDVDGQLAPEGSPSQAEASSSSSSLAAWNGPYFSTALAGYGLALGLTFVANEVTKAGQPALVYIVPLVLGSVLLTAARRGEVGELFAFEATRDDLGA
jgi:minor histocompatibility antigen H13